MTFPPSPYLLAIRLARLALILMHSNIFSRSKSDPMLFKQVSDIVLSDGERCSHLAGIYLAFDLDLCLAWKASSKSNAIYHKWIKLHWLFLNRPRYEPRIQPNFNSLIENSNPLFGADKIVDDLMNLIPSSLSVSIHSLFKSTNLSTLFFYGPRDCELMSWNKRFQ